MGSPHSTDPRSDVELIADINAGDESAFQSLYFRYRDWVVRLAWRFTANRDDALDVLQETFAYLLRKSPKLTLSAKMTSFLYPVVRNLSLEIRRKRRRDQDESILEDLPAPPAKELSDLDRLIRSLPAAQREVVLMRFVDDMSLAEIAGALSIPEGTAKSRLHHALETLRAQPGILAYFQA